MTSLDHELPGFGRAWHGVVPARLIVSGSSEEFAEYHDQDGGVDFFTAPASDLNSYVYTEQGVSRRSLSVVGSPGASRVDFFQTGASVAGGAGEMRLDFGNGEYILFRRADTFRLTTDIRYLVPTEHGFADGYRQWFDYADVGEYPTAMRDSFGRQVTISWQDANALDSQISYKVISQIQLPDGGSLSYQYEKAPARSAAETSFYAGNPQDRLVSATHRNASGSPVWSHSYLYEDLRSPYALTGVVDQNGQRLSTFAYSDAGLAISTQQAGGFQKYAVEYLQDAPPQRLQHHVRNVTNPLGQVERYTFFRDQDAPAGMQPSLTQIDRLVSPTVPASTQTFSYTNTTGYDFLVSGTQDPRGTASAMTVDTANRRPTAVTEAAGTSAARMTSTSWHAQFDFPTHEEREGLSTDYTYTTGGQLLTRTETDTTTQTVPYATSGQTRTTTYTWDTNGRLLSINGPLAADGLGHDDAVTFTYDANGNRLTMTDGLGHVTQYGSYDANGRPGTATDMNGVVTAFTYDDLGHVKTITVRHPTNASLDAVTSLDYDVEGRVTGVTRPVTEKIFFEYNLAGLMTSVHAADGERKDYAYDPMGNVTSETVRRADGSAASSIARTFDSLGRILSETLGPSRVTRWAYDANGNVTTVTDPVGSPTTQAFDPLDRVMAVVAPDGGTTQLAYDQKDGLTQNTDPKSVTTQFVRNGFGEVIQETSPDRGTSITWYDAAGNITRSQDGRGQIIDYTRDILGRVTQKTPQSHTSETVSYSWDTGGLSASNAIGRPGAITDASGTTQFAYDHRGNMLIQQQAIGATAAAQLSYVYDLADRITQITYPSGRMVQYGRDTKGRVNLIQTRSSSTGAWTVVADTFAYEPFAAMKAVRFGNGLSAAIDWGNDGRLASRRLYTTSTGANLSWLTYGYDSNDNITAISDQIDDTRSIFYGYDTNGRLTRTLMTASGAPAGPDTYNYAAGTNRLSSISNTGGARTFDYDSRGNLAGESRPGSVSVTTTYDSFGRLTGYARTGIGTLAFTYNGRDDRVTMTNDIGTRRFVYAPDGRVLGEYGLSSADVKAEFIWMQPEVANDNMFGGGDGAGGYAPLAVATPDSVGTIVLNWVHGNHLGVPLVTTDGSGTPAMTPGDYLAPGFPGQSRVLADLYYNRYRDFDPTTGRYIQADPIGLQGGQNDYAYVGGNPVNRTDPSGLFVPIVIAGVCAGGGCEAAGAAILGALWYLTHPFKLPPRDPPIPPATPHDPSCDPDDYCEAEWAAELDYCSETFGVVGWQHRACKDRARQNYLDCRDGLPHRGRWKDSDMGPNLPRPPRKKRRW
jgi:RHS repeat-associated protein